MSFNYFDFQDADPQHSGFDLIPKGFIAPMRMTLKPGGYDDPSQGWTGGYATQSFETGSVYLAAEFVITGGEYAKRKLWSNIGLHSPKGPIWGQMGRSFIRAALNSARHLRPQDNSPQAAAAQRDQGGHRARSPGVRQVDGWSGQSSGGGRSDRCRSTDGPCRTEQRCDGQAVLGAVRRRP